jgi:succinoglycan biosynthesis protein ExoO
MTPTVSVIMPARDVEDLVGAALGSVLSQNAPLEVLVVDDASRDGTAAAVAAVAAGDPRVRLLRGAGAGPGAARNLALRAARAPWAAVVDADDLIARGRLARLVSIGEDLEADLVADNLTAFYPDGTPDHAWLSTPAWASERLIDLHAYLKAGVGDARADQLGYLKPIMRIDFLRRHNLTYDESLTIGEDFDLVLRALAAGAVYRYTPASGYRYRRRAGSISHRIDAAQLERMGAALTATASVLPADARRLATRRLEALEADLQFARLVAALKAGAVAPAARAMRSREMRARFRQAAREGLAARLRRLKPRRPAD